MKGGPHGLLSANPFSPLLPDTEDARLIASWLFSLMPSWTLRERCLPPPSLLTSHHFLALCL